MGDPQKKLQKALLLGNIFMNIRLLEKMPQNILWAKEVVVERNLVQGLATMSQ
jgi:hypothetical protein